MSLLPIVTIGLAAALIIPTFLYYQMMKRVSRRPWSIEPNLEYTPLVTVILPTYNEIKIIDKKIDNLEKIDYPSNRLEIIIVDSASSDGTMDRCRELLRQKQLKFPTRLVSEDARRGKAHALNAALKHARGELIATTDADSFWKTDALRIAVSYFADSKVGAVSGREIFINAEQNDYTLAENTYRKHFYVIRLGESKLYSTILFQGELSVYRRTAFSEFEDRPGYSDDTGTVLRILSNHYRTLFIPEAVFFDSAPYTLTDRMSLKSRRGQHVISAALSSVRLRRILPSEIIVFNLVFNVVCPVGFPIEVILCAILIYSYNLWWLLLVTIPIIAFRRLRIMAISFITSNLALVLAMAGLLLRLDSVAWKKIERMRTVYETVDTPQFELKSP